MPAARQDDCQRNRHEQVRAILFHVGTILVFRFEWSFGPGDRRLLRLIMR